LGRSKIAIEKEPSTQNVARVSKDWRRIILGLVISAISLAIVFYFADFRRLGEALSLANYRLVALALMMSFVWLFVRGWLWRTLLQKRATFSQCFFTECEGYLVNNLLPIRLGELARAFLMGRKANLGFWEVFSTILIERILDLAMAACLVLATLPFVVGAPWARQAALGTSGVVVLALVGLYLLARYQDWAMALFGKLARRWPFLDRLAGNRLKSFLNGLTVLTNTGLFLRAIMFEILNWIVALFQYYFLLLAFVPQAKLLWGAFGLGLAAFGNAVPSSPGAVGVLELSLVGALSIFGIDPSVALAFALTAHVINYLSTGVPGAYALVRDGESLTGLYSRVRKMPTS
jgi:uncharacterized protein (TIRG00374 family)